ncbi:PaaI family thioesterase [Salsuginibacillus kocurii]|uniref:PaaI family thioesterase n=1 Tax=Salsuginibacillus kocurii TaxID=427078 RepID=UPI0003738769|nr:PaaI family thioesterase [Salsuginibacillus kocurii]
MNAHSVTQDQLKTKLNKLAELCTAEDLKTLDHLTNGLLQYQDGGNSSYIGSWLQPERKLLENGSFQMKIPITPLVYNSLHIVHGGITATLIDMVTGGVIHAHLPETKGAVTTDLQLRYFKPGKGNELTCYGTLLRLGQSLCTAEGIIFDDKGDLIAKGTATYAVIEKP